MLERIQATLTCSRVRSTHSSRESPVRPAFCSAWYWAVSARATAGCFARSSRLGRRLLVRSAESSRVRLRSFAFLGPFSRVATLAGVLGDPAAQDAQALAVGSKGNW